MHLLQIAQWKLKLKTLPFSALLRKLDVMTKRKYAKTGRKRGFYALFCYSKFLLFPMSAKIRKNNLDLSNASFVTYKDIHGWQLTLNQRNNFNNYQPSFLTQAS